MWTNDLTRGMRNRGETPIETYEVQPFGIFIQINPWENKYNFQGAVRLRKLNKIHHRGKIISFRENKTKKEQHWESVGHDHY